MLNGQPYPFAEPSVSETDKVGGVTRLLPSPIVDDCNRICIAIKEYLDSDSAHRESDADGNSSGIHTWTNTRGGEMFTGQTVYFDNMTL